MKSCNCTLHLSNPDACKNCLNQICSNWDIDKLFKNFYYFTDWNTYNPETHELVEKKEAKIKRLKEELSSNEETIKVIDEQVLSFSKKKSELIVKNNQISEELKSLE